MFKRLTAIPVRPSTAPQSETSIFIESGAYSEIEKQKKKLKDKQTRYYYQYCTRTGITRWPGRVPTSNLSSRRVSPGEYPPRTRRVSDRTRPHQRAIPLHQCSYCFVTDGGGALQLKETAVQRVFQFIFPKPSHWKWKS